MSAAMWALSVVRTLERWADSQQCETASEGSEDAAEEARRQKEEEEVLMDEEATRPLSASAASLEVTPLLV